MDHPQTDEEKQHLKGYRGKDARIVGYLVQTRAAGFTVDLLVSLATQQAQAAGPQFGMEPWTTAAAKGPGERWAVAMAEHVLGRHFPVMGFDGVADFGRLTEFARHDRTRHGM